MCRMCQCDTSGMVLLVCFIEYSLYALGKDFVLFLFYDAFFYLTHSCNYMNPYSYYVGCHWFIFFSLS